MYRAVPVLSLAVALLVTTSDAPAGSLAASLAEKGYALVVEKGDIAVYRHKDPSRIRLVAEGRFDAPPERVRATLLDYERHVGEVDRVAESRVLTRGDDHLMVYQRLALPIVSDRDMTLRVTWGGGRDRPWIAYEAVSGGPSAPAGVVRLRHYRGKWKLRAADGGASTRARLFVEMEMGGSLPPALASANAGKDIPALFAAIERLTHARTAQRDR